MLDTTENSFDFGNGILIGGGCSCCAGEAPVISEVVVELLDGAHLAHGWKRQTRLSVLKRVSQSVLQTNKFKSIKIFLICSSRLRPLPTKEIELLSRAGLSKIYLHSQRHDGPHNTFTEPENAISAEKNVPKVYLSYADLAKIWKVGKQLLVLDYFESQQGHFYISHSNFLHRNVAAIFANHKQRKRKSSTKPQAARFFLKYP
ncbi:hypothetical protein AB4K20DRAFT_1872121 [Rhizopus microsporus]